MTSQFRKILVFLPVFISIFLAWLGNLTGFLLPTKIQPVHSLTTPLTTTTPEVFIETEEVLLVDEAEADLVLGAILPPDFSKHPLKGVYSATPEAVAVVIERSDKSELWLYNSSGDKRQMSVDVAADFPVGLKDGFFFWLSEDRKTLHVYSPEHDEYFWQGISEFDPAKGERAKARFPGISWEIIIDAFGFYFFNQEAGEVFSDGSSDAKEEFGTQHNLHQLVPAEQMNALGFITETVDLNIDQL